MEREEDNQALDMFVDSSQWADHESLQTFIWPFCRLPAPLTHILPLFFWHVSLHAVSNAMSGRPTPSPPLGRLLHNLGSCWQPPHDTYMSYLYSFNIMQRHLNLSVVQLPQREFILVQGTSRSAMLDTGVHRTLSIDCRLTYAIVPI
ncbi:hypothetical protein GYMLUDRAFT_552010 [Collybiopsis luxurians FD-317 M1]|uniref:Unplaced genomic scaffold GYMLUscaffold_20, whole genome shotgun sequence n=1 Tax=Collybiopsis luxurians FD-317 M1 TaxID=944289 RepID=A0A0D0CS80_9AGAR|nr:hypothetical protein GYMLUDRAFT_552010 [Collybiopsis luxurians FD-317 M1]